MEPGFSCEECHMRFSCESEIKAHQRAVHRQMSWFSCHLCEVSFKSSVSLQSHLKERHSGKVRQHPFTCWICRDQGDIKSYPRYAKLMLLLFFNTVLFPTFIKICGQIKSLELTVFWWWSGGLPLVRPYSLINNDIKLLLS